MTIFKGDLTKIAEWLEKRLNELKPFYAPKVQEYHSRSRYTTPNGMESSIGTSCTLYHYSQLDELSKIIDWIELNDNRSFGIENNKRFYYVDKSNKAIYVFEDPELAFDLLLFINRHLWQMICDKKEDKPEEPKPIQEEELVDVQTGSPEVIVFELHQKDDLLDSTFVEGLNANARVYLNDVVNSLINNDLNGTTILIAGTMIAGDEVADELLIEGIMIYYADKRTAYTTLLACKEEHVISLMNTCLYELGRDYPNIKNIYINEADGTTAHKLIKFGFKPCTAAHAKQRAGEGCGCASDTATPFRYSI